MKSFDLIIRGGTLVTHERVAPADLAVADGCIVATGEGLSGEAHETIDARGLHIFPGLIDSHVHFNDPGRAHWEGIETGSRALAAGGGTLFFDMPLNAHPPTIDAASFDLKLAAAEKSSLTDFAFWGGLVPDNLDKLEELAARGVIGFKAFMSNSGIEDFPRANDHALREGMKRAAKLGKLVAVHAESEEMTRALAEQKISRKQICVRDYLDSRPVPAELEAIGRAIELAGETGCALHIVHVSSGQGVGLVIAGRERGVDVTCETCPHYLTLTDKDVENLGAVAKCAPPLRSAQVQSELWARVLAGEVQSIGSDHSPSPPDMKRDENIFKAWGGISGVQDTLPLLLTCRRRRETDLREDEFSVPGAMSGLKLLTSSTTDSMLARFTAFHIRRMTLFMIVRLTSFNVAERFKLPTTKGRFVTGADADLALVDLKAKFTVRPEDLFYRHKHSPYVGRALTGRVVRTILRGQTIFHDGKIVTKPMGRFVKPLA